MEAFQGRVGEMMYEAGLKHGHGNHRSHARYRCSDDSTPQFHVGRAAPLQISPQLSRFIHAASLRFECTTPLSSSERKMVVWAQGRFRRGLQACSVPGTILLLSWLECRRPLRRSVEPKLRREVRNLSVAGVSAIAVVMAERPLVMPLAVWVEKQNWGLVRFLGLPQWLEMTAALLLMDYAFYVWHVLMHRVPILWRMHLVHHVDLDLDASTALRFHFTEMLASIPWRAGQVVLIGLTPFSFSVWQCVFLSPSSFTIPTSNCRSHGSGG